MKICFKKVLYFVEISYFVEDNYLVMSDMKDQRQMSETMRLAIVLAIAGGFMDAYSYICRGGVFANAETGNIVLMAINFSNGHLPKALQYLIPITAFALGVVVSEIIRLKNNEQGMFHWRQISLIIEIIALVISAFLPQSMNLIVNSLISFTCGTQVATFAKFHGYAMATTMCTGNLRSGTQNLCEFFIQKDRKLLDKAFAYYGCIVFFIIGAIIGKFVSDTYNEKAILVASALLLVAFIMMFIDTNKRD